MTVIQDRLTTLPELKSGGHRGIKDGACLLEWAA
jgi:hypothetical protein